MNQRRASQLRRVLNLSRESRAYTARPGPAGVPGGHPFAGAGAF
jgi:hypothetical protein